MWWMGQKIPAEGVEVTPSCDSAVTWLSWGFRGKEGEFPLLPKPLYRQFVTLFRYFMSLYIFISDSRIYIYNNLTWGTRELTEVQDTDT